VTNASIKVLKLERENGNRRRCYRFARFFGSGKPTGSREQ